MTVTAGLVKELRERTGAGMMECKKYLVQTNGDIEKAIEAMRKEGVMKAAKREGKITAEGIVMPIIADDQCSAVMVEVNCETDFVARSDDFKQFVGIVVQRALETKAKDAASLINEKVDPKEALSIEEMRQHLIAKLGENVNIRRVEFIKGEGQIGRYSHGDRIGVLVDVVGGDEALRKDIAMHIAASNPRVVDASQVPADMIEKETEIFEAQAASSGKPPETIKKMIEGRIKKYLDEVSLQGQPFVKDPSLPISAVLKKANATVKYFVRFEVGEGIEKKQVDFAKEVMEQVGGTSGSR